MACFNNITTNAGGVPYIANSNVTVSDTTVDIALGWFRRNLPPVGYFTVRVANEIPTGTTGTLPVTLSLNGVTRNLTLPNGTQVTASDLEGVVVFTVFNDRFNGILALVSRTTV